MQKHWFRARASVASSLCAALAVGCPPGGAASVVRPRAVTAAQALGEDPAKCSVPGGTPLIVDWKDHERASLEEAMTRGIPVVSYSCQGLRLLSDCSMEGIYGFMSTSRKSTVVQLANTEEVKANLPQSALKLLGSFEGELRRGASIDLATVLVGKRTTTVRQAERSALHGDCASATHFVRGAFVGAFAVRTGTSGKLRSVAQIFGAGAEAEMSSVSSIRGTDGDPQACSRSSVSAMKPPDDCAALLRLEVVALGRGAAAEDGACPEGTVAGEGKCASASSSVPHLCKRGNASDCEAQCKLAHSPSCGRLGLMYIEGNGVAKDVARAAKLLQQACDGGDALGCSSLGVQVSRGEGLPRSPDRAAALFRTACDAGETLGCVNLGAAYGTGVGVKKNLSLAAGLYQRACDGGDALGCTNLGAMYSMGESVARDFRKAVALYRRACDGEDGAGCSNLGVKYVKGEGVQKDTKVAAAMYRRACDLKSGEGCLNLGEAYESGSIVPQDVSKAAKYYELACDQRISIACVNLGALYVTGEGLPQDVARARELFRRACALGNPTGCRNVARLGGR